MAFKYNEVEQLKRRNAELEREVRERREREDSLMADLKRMRERVEMAEEAEERLCVQLGDLEAEAVEQVHAYRNHIKLLNAQLELVKKIMVRADPDAINGIALVA